MNRKHLTLILVTLVAAAVLLSACSAGIFSAAATPTPAAPVTSKSSASVEGRVMPKAYANLAFEANGEISALPVAEGQEVSQGSVLVSLGKHEQLDAALASARLEQVSATQALDTLNRQADLAKGLAEQALRVAEKASIDAAQVYSDLDNDTFKNNLDDKEKAVQTAKDTLKDKNDTLDKYLNLDPDNQTRKDAQKAVDDAQKVYDDAVRARDLYRNTRDQALANRDAADAKLADAQHDYENRQNGPDKDQLALLQVRVDEANAAVKAAQSALDNMDLKAPFNGMLTDLNGLAVGQFVTAGRTAVQIADFSEWYVETKDLTELDVVDVSLGQKVTMKADVLPDAALKGTVTAIKKVYTERSGDVLYTVRIKLDQADPKLAWGMTVQVTFVK